MKALGSRVDALVMAFRVRLDASFVASLREHQLVANEHGRHAFRWSVDVPDPDRHGHVRLGPQRVRFASEADRTQRTPRLWGELRYSAAPRVYRVVNEPYFRLQVKEAAEGGGGQMACGSCAGRGWNRRVTTAHRYDVITRERCCQCAGVGAIKDPGWTIEIIWYAQELARRGLEACIAESAAIAAMTGEVLQSRLRRIDLCADIDGWEIRREDEECLAKRPRARTSIDYGAANDTFEREPQPIRCGPGCTLQVPPPKRPSATCTCHAINAYGTGGPMARRKITGLSVGRGGAFMARIYDKRAELERDEDRRGLEEERWRASGWDGQSSVTRVEFQIRGQGLDELGLRDPDGCVVPVFQSRAYVDKRGKSRIRAVILGQRILHTTDKTGEEVQVTLVHRLEAIWRTCLDWVRLVVPGYSRQGRPLPTSRLKDDPRWALLRSVRFCADDALPIRRYRPRGAASAAQALGVTLSQAGRVGSLREDLPIEREAYSDDDATTKVLLDKITGLKIKEAAFIVEELLTRHGGAAGASRHFAIRHNAARARFMSGVELLLYDDKRPEQAKVA